MPQTTYVYAMCVTAGTVRHKDKQRLYIAWHLS